MFPSSSNGINYSTPFFPNITSPSLKYEHLQLDPSFFNPCYDDFIHNEISTHQEDLRADFASNNDKNQILTGKRCAKRDRHSKIETAQGPRDRRMRLPLKVARAFFDLQDQLSFDKASKTIEWLMIQASSEIEQLLVNRTASSTSECEVISEINEEDETAKAAKTAAFRKGKSVKPSMGPRGKELRAKARAKARERTTEKQQRDEKTAQIHHFDDEAPAKSAGGSISGEEWSPFPDLSHLYNLGFPQEESEMADFHLWKPMWE